MLPVALIGYGKMGKLIAELAPQYGVEIVSKIDPTQAHCQREINMQTLSGAKTCIDFSVPEKVLGNVQAAASCGCNIVIGTTGWQGHLADLESIAKIHQIGIVYGSNFSVGMNVFYHIVQYAVRMIDRLPEYDIYGLELHHNQKLDSPSGTAKELAQMICQNSLRKQIPVYETLNRKIKPEELHFGSVRAGSIPGTHTVGFDSLADNIELVHRARSRQGFALGALKAAVWAASLKGVYEFKELIGDVLAL